VQNLITDVAGVRVGNSEDPGIATGLSVVLFEEPTVASVKIGRDPRRLRRVAVLTR